MALKGHHRAPFSNGSFIRRQILQILNLPVSKCFYESFAIGSKFQSKTALEFSLREFGHNMSMALDKDIYFKESTLVTVSYLVHYDTLYKKRQPFYYKMRQKFITKCVMFFITKCCRFITKCDSYYKMRCLSQNVSVQAFIICWSKYAKLQITCPFIRRFNNVLW